MKTVIDKGGLGKGITDLGDWGQFGSYPPVPIGQTNSLGNKSGFVEYTCAKSDDNSLAPQTLQVNSYRGVENPFGHCWKMVDGIKCLVEKEEGRSTVYICDDKEKWSSNGLDGYEPIGFLPRQSGFIKDIILGEFGEVMPLSIGASSTTHFCDFLYTHIYENTYECYILFGGDVKWVNAGLICSFTPYGSLSRNSTAGTRLCFIP